MSVKDLRNRKFKLSLVIVVLGTLSISQGILNLIMVVKNANEIQCRMWPYSKEGQNVYMQGCNAFECNTPIPITLSCKEKGCDLSTMGAIDIYGHLKCYILKEPIRIEGFSSLNQMSQAALR